MKKKLYHLTIFVLMMGMCFVSFNINTYATEKSTEGNELSSEFQKSLDSVSLAEIKKYFEESISELNSEKNQAESKEQRDSIDSDIKIYKSILQDIDNKKVNEESVTRGKQLLDNKSQIAKSDVVIMSLADDVRTAVLATIVVGDNMGYNFAARLLAHSLGATTNSTYDIWNTDSLVSNRVKASSYYKNKLSSLRQTYKNSGQVNGFYRTFKDLEFSGGNSTVEKDMYYAIHGLSGGGSVSVNNGYGELVLNDTYDFPGLAFPSDFSTALNNLGSIAVSQGVCHIYNVKIHTVESFYDYVPSNPYPGYYIQYGSTGSYVVMVQNRLNSLGFNCGAADGIFGNNTKNAVISFQRSRGLDADGIVGPTTWEYLFNR